MSGLGPLTLWAGGRQPTCSVFLGGAIRWRVTSTYREGPAGQQRVTRATGSSLRPELLCLRGESLLRSDQPRLAVEAFEAVVQDGPGPYLPQALFGNARAHAAAGNPGEAALARERLLRDHADTPWARRATAEPLS